MLCRRFPALYNIGSHLPFILRVNGYSQFGGKFYVLGKRTLFCSVRWLQIVQATYLLFSARHELRQITHRSLAVAKQTAIRLRKHRAVLSATAGLRCYTSPAVVSLSEFLMAFSSEKIDYGATERWKIRQTVTNLTGRRNWCTAQYSVACVHAVKIRGQNWKWTSMKIGSPVTVLLTKMICELPNLLLTKQYIHRTLHNRSINRRHRKM